MTCGTCGRDCLPDGDCYGCEADRQRGLATALAEASNMWRAHAEALAGALANILPFIHQPMYYVSDQHTTDRARAALARLPADALAERKALEAAFDAACILERESSHAMDCQFTACTCGAAVRRRAASLAFNATRRALDAARRQP